MAQNPNILLVAGSLKRASITRVVLQAASEQFTHAGCPVDFLDLAQENLPLYNPDHARAWPGYEPLRQRVDRADVLVLGSPDYHGSIGSGLKNFLDHFWYEFTGKLFAPVVASHEKGLTVIDQLRTVARQCYAWSLPYGIACMEKIDVKDGQIVSDGLRDRLQMLVRDARVYGQILATQRRADLTCADQCFMARHRK